MGRSQETFSKKEREKKRRKKKQEKLEKKLERKANSNKGKPLEEMFSYVDADGNLTSTPPDPRDKPKVKLADIQVSIPKKDDSDDDPGFNAEHTGKITNFSEGKGYGFILDDQTRESIFVHVSDMIDRVGEGSRVKFKVKRGPKGFSATEVRQA